MSSYALLPVFRGPESPPPLKRAARIEYRSGSFYAYAGSGALVGIRNSITAAQESLDEHTTLAKAGGE